MPPSHGSSLQLELMRALLLFIPQTIASKLAAGSRTLNGYIFFQYYRRAFAPRAFRLPGKESSSPPPSNARGSVAMLVKRSQQLPSAFRIDRLSGCCGFD